MAKKNLKIAIVHDWLETYAGAEKVLEQILEIYPDADLFSLVDFVEGDRSWLKGRTPVTTWIQKLPMAKKRFRNYIFLFPMAVRGLDLSTYDVVISSSHCMAKNVRIREGQIHICYCHSPVRYAWDMRDEYLAQSGLDRGLLGGIKANIIRGILGYVKWEDLRGTKGVTHFIANSSFIGQRIKNCYGRESIVINPPVDTESMEFVGKKDDYYVTMSRMVPYKRIDLIAAAFAKMPKRKLVIIGSGPEKENVMAAAAGAKNVQLCGYLQDKDMKEYLKKARAFAFAAKEDFGIAPVEAMACGTPVIAFGEGGALDSIVGLDGKAPTGVFFKQQTVDSIIEAVESFEANEKKIKPEACRTRAEWFSNDAFKQRFADYVTSVVQ